MAKWDIFHYIYYIYAVLHPPNTARDAENSAASRSPPPPL
jgi:hypothetical protein